MEFLSVFLLAFLCQDVKIDFDFQIEEIKGRYNFVITGTADLSDNSALIVQISYAYEVNIMGDVEKFLETIAEEEVIVKDGHFQFVFGDYNKKPPSIEYQISVSYKDHNFTKTIPKDPRQIQKESKESIISIKQDIEKLYHLYILSQQRITQFLQGQYDVKKWKEFHKFIKSEINKLQTSNDARFGWYAFRADEIGKNAIKNLLSHIEELLSLYNNHILNGTNLPTKEIEETKKFFEHEVQNLCEAFEFIYPAYTTDVKESIKKLQEQRENREILVQELFKLNRMLPKVFRKRIYQITQQIINNHNWQKELEEFIATIQSKLEE